MNKFEKYLNEIETKNVTTLAIENSIKKNVQGLLRDLSQLLDSLSDSDQLKNHEKDAIKLQKQLENFYKKIR